MAPSAISSQDIAEAVLRSVNGVYPDTDEIASAELTPDVLPAILSSLEQSILRTKEDIRQLKDAHKDEIISWTTEARSLHDNLASTKAAAAEVKRLEQEGTELEERTRDSSLQRGLLSSEIQFNEELVDILTSLNFIQSLYDEAQELAMNGSLLPANEQIEQADHALTGFKGMSQVLAVELLKQRSSSLKSALIETVEEYWMSLVQVYPAEQSLTILSSISVANVEVAGETIAETMKSMKILKERVDKLQQSIDSIFISPRLDERPKMGDVIAFSIDPDNNTLRVSGRSDDLSTEHLFNDLRFLFDFLAQRLHSSVIKQLTKTLIPSLTTRLQSTYLPSQIPTSLIDLPQFENVLNETSIFEDYLEQQGWIKPSDRDLRDWVTRAPKLWLNKRRERSLDGLKQNFMRGLGAFKTVERVETMVEVNGVLEEQKVPERAAGADNWDAKWDSEEETHDASAPTSKLLMSRNSTSNPTPEPHLDDDDEDVSGWGLDEDLTFDDDEAKSSDPSEPMIVDAPGHGVDNVDDRPLDVDWEWGDEDQDGTQKEPGHPERPKQRSRKTSVAGIAGEKKGNNITLKETYKITFVPQGVMEILLQVLQDADELASNTYKQSTIASSAGGMLQIPSSIIAGYRALSALFYSGNTNSAMCLYNDCVWLEDQLSSLQAARKMPLNGKNLDLSTDRKALSAFGKRAYSRELESQRLIVSDLMDGAQGFASCTDYPLSTECETAISGVVERIQVCYGSWKETLSQSNLYQAIGSLLNTVATKFINDIEDLPDISADESTKLAALCAEIIKLEVLFTPADQAAEAVPVTAVYCDHWLKFQYLANILECTMVDLMHLWREGTLVDFEKDELIDLVKALFADGEKRTKVIDEIRRG